MIGTSTILINVQQMYVFPTFHVGNIISIGTIYNDSRYDWIPLSKILQERFKQYNSISTSHDGYVMIEIVNGVYGLP